MRPAAPSCFRGLMGLSCRHDDSVVRISWIKASGPEFVRRSKEMAERREGIWRLFGFDAVYLRDEIAPVIPGQIVAVDPQALEGFRPTYRLLSYCLASGGFPVPNDLAGIDRPDLVDALVREIYGWAGLSPPH